MRADIHFFSSKQKGVADLFHRHMINGAIPDTVIEFLVTPYRTIMGNLLSCHGRYYHRRQR